MAERKTDEETTMSTAHQTMAPRALQTRIRLALGAGAIAIIAALALGAGSAQANTGITAYSTSISTTQAGGHPDIAFHAEFDNHLPVGNAPCRCDDPRIYAQHFPTGFIGNPHVAAFCTAVQLLTGSCPVESQVGTYSVTVGFDFGYGPVYNMETQPDQAGLTGFMVPLVVAPSMIELSARTDSDYGLEASSPPIFHILPLAIVTFRLWGVPSDPVHDANRFFTPQKEFANCLRPYPEPCGPDITTAHSNLPPKPFLESPTACGVPLSSSIDITYYSQVTDHAEAPWPSTTGCDQLAFNPSLTAQPTTTQADTSSGLDVDIKVPQTQSPTTPSPSEIRATTITLPEGFSLNPNGSDGKEACTDAQAKLGTRDGAQCPEASKIGTVRLDSSALPGPIDGSIYIGTPQPDQTFRLILTADGFGTHVKLPGVTDTDPQTGQLIARFVDLPQSPFQDFSLHFFGSERGIFSTPKQCGTYQVKSEFVPWDSVLPDQTSLSSFTIDSGPNGEPCPDAKRPFSPRLAAGTTNSTAGKHAQFVLDVNRDDGDQNIVGIHATTPPGLSGSLRGIPYCPESALAQLADPSRGGLAELAAPACPAASRVGITTAATGSGTHPLYTAGKLYLAGPYKGAPLSLEAVVPAVSGPYDLGNVAVRTAIYVDPTTAQLSAVSDPIPAILGGVPLRVRETLIDLDRPNFIVNPTNCDPFAIDATLFGDEGARASFHPRFQVSNCAELAYAPKLALRLSGGVARRGHPAITATFTAGAGQANSRRIAVTLPKGELLDNSHIGTVCTRVAFAAKDCPASSRIGTVTVATPLLDQPLTGSVYLRSSSHELPDLALDLNGQIDVEASARVDSFNGGLRTTFETVPDVPLGAVTLHLLGGSKGLLQNSKGLCGRSKKATVRMVGQNGMVVNRKTKLQVSCGSTARRKRHSERSAHARKAG
jgi:hypothetical protein